MTDKLTLFSVRSVFAPLVAGTGTVPITSISSETFSFLLSGDFSLVELGLFCASIQLEFVDLVPSLNLLI